MNKLNTRNVFIDNLKGLLIYCVVLGHICENYEMAHPNLKFLIFFIYLFHMPCFIYISGYFSKKYDFRKNVKLIYQFVVFGVVYCFIVNKFPRITARFQIAQPPVALWYLLALFYWRTIINFIKTKKIKTVITISFICAIFVGCLKNVGTYFSLARAVGFFPFFLLGFYSNESLLEKIKNINKVVIFLLLIIILISTFAIVSKDLIPLMFQWASKSFDELGISFAKGILFRVIFFVLEICSCIVVINLIPKRETIFTKFGENSIIIFGFHTSLVFSIKYFINDVKYKGEIYLFVLLVSFAIVFVLNLKPIQKLYKILMKPYEKMSE